ncbi:MFS transporter [Saccharopolyspora gloriosae]|uniref:MFS transporter n=1 Tax=Saccharopolyspora gloriosae TaxID=455344 RepID=UPI001FB64083|nr:MFS transporter [Saccharopolyspora gloriosae]
MRTGIYLLVVLTAGAYLPSPLYPGYQRAFEISDLTMTLLYATFALVSAPALLLFGSASDALGARSVLRAGVVLSAAGSLCFAFAANPGWLMAGRAAQGLALGAVTTAATALINGNAPDSSRHRAAVLASTAFLLGTAAGPVAAGVLAQHVWAPLFSPYLLHLVLLGFGWSRVSALPASAGPPLRRWRPERPHIPRGTRRSFATAAATGFLAWTVVGIFLAVVPVLLDRAGHADLAVIGCVLGAVLVCSASAQPLVLRFGARPAQLAGLGGLFVSLVLLALTGGGSLPITLGAAVVAGVGHGFAYGGAAGTIEDVAPPEERGAVVGALYVAFYLGAGCPAIAVGLVTLGSSLETATSWVTAVAGAFVPVVAVAVATVGHPRDALPVAPARAARLRDPRSPLRLIRRSEPLRGNRFPEGRCAAGRAGRWRRSRRPRPAGGRSRPS